MSSAGAAEDHVTLQAPMHRDVAVGGILLKPLQIGARQDHAHVVPRVIVQRTLGIIGNLHVEIHVPTELSPVLRTMNQR